MSGSTVLSSFIADLSAAWLLLQDCTQNLSIMVSHSLRTGTSTLSELVESGAVRPLRSLMLVLQPEATFTSSLVQFFGTAANQPLSGAAQSSEIHNHSKS